MFNFKDLYQLQSRAREIQKRLASEIIAVEKSGIKITMNGKQEILTISLNADLDKEEQEKVLIDLLNEAVRKVQQLMAKQMMV